jgi:CheY-like chemotaxis protein
MDAAQKLIQALASLLWPVIVMVIILRFRPAITAIVESARSRKFTLKIGGQELTMEEANQTQQKLIADLQSQVAEIQKKLEPAPASPQAVAAAPMPQIQNVKTLLWVDDNPKNNSYFVEHLSELGVKVDTATSTAEAARLFDTRRYDYVISDMGRMEGGKFNGTAGLDLLKMVRAKNAQVPFVFFTSARALDNYGQQALAMGATGMTSSSTRLFGILNLDTAMAPA